MGKIYAKKTAMIFSKFHKILGVLVLILFGYSSAPVFAQDEDQPTACKQAASLDFPEADQPTDAEAKALAGCDAENLYYGIGVKRDYVTARKCALLDARTVDYPSEMSLQDSDILAMIYANGYGVKKNFDLAIQEACDAYGSQVEISGRIAHLQELKILKPGQKLKECQKGTGYSKNYCDGVFDFCDDVSSGYTGGLCAGIALGQDEEKRHLYIAETTRLWSQKDKDLYKALSKASEAYSQNHADEEIDFSGSARIAFATEAEDDSNNDFLTTFKALENQKFPNDRNQNFSVTDKKLNDVYVSVLKKIVTPNNMTTIKMEGIRTTQRSWIVYRDAWVKFAASRYPALSQSALETLLTNKRIEELQKIPTE